MENGEANAANYHTKWFRDQFEYIAALYIWLKFKDCWKMAQIVEYYDES